MKHVFPLLPILSRTDLGYWPAQDTEIPQPRHIARLPTHVLAAVYASALPFCQEDSHLSLFLAYQKSPISRLWHIVYELVQEEVHRPQLSVLQASLLYLHRQIPDESTTACAAINSPFIWTFMGTVVGLAHALGLHLECRFFGLPSWEKRLRRRLWWAVYIEDKWMSLMLGRPPFIKPEEWDVEKLSESDFRCGLPVSPPSTGALSHDGAPFCHMALLSCIAEEVQTKL